MNETGERWWRCLHFGTPKAPPIFAPRELRSVETVEPPSGAKEFCTSTKQGAFHVHACFVAGETIEEAIIRVRTIHDPVPQ